jgi:hypothetical protein
MVDAAAAPTAHKPEQNQLTHDGRKPTNHKIRQVSRQEIRQLPDHKQTTDDILADQPKTTTNHTIRQQVCRQEIWQSPDAQTDDNADGGTDTMDDQMKAMTMTKRTLKMMTTRPDRMDEDHAVTLFEFVGWEALPSAHEHASNLSIRRHDNGRRRQRELTRNDLKLQWKIMQYTCLSS